MTNKEIPDEAVNAAVAKADECLLFMLHLMDCKSDDARADPGDDLQPMAPDALIFGLRIHVLFPQLSEHTRGTLSGMVMLAREIVFGANTQGAALTAAERVEHERLLTDMEVHYMDGKKLLFSCPELARLSPLQMAILRHIIEVKFSRV